MNQTIEALSTEQVVTAMLRENTGSHFLDSGGAYGRNWQRNQTRDFSDEPTVYTTWNVWKPTTGPHKIEADSTVSLYHWMVNALEFDPELQAELDQFTEEEAMAGESWLGISDAFVERLAELGRIDPKDGHSCINTYNDPDYCWLSQVLQYQAINLDGDDAFYPTHLIVHVHGGCDVRGGYTAPKCFRLTSQGADYFRDWMRPTVLCAGDQTWFLQGYQEFEASDRNTCNVDDPFKLPVYDVEALKDALAEQGYTDREIVGVEIALEGLAKVERAVNGEPGHELLQVTLPKEKTLAELAKRRKELEDELLAACVKGIGLLHQHALLVTDRRHCYLVDGDNELADELKFYADFS